MISVTHHAVLAAFSLALLLNSTGYADESCDCAATSEGSADGSGSGSGVAVLQPKAAVAPARSVSEGAVVSPLLSIAAGTAASSEFSAGLEVRFSTGPEVEFSFAPTVQANTTNGVRELLSIRAGDVNVSSGVGGGVAFTLFGLRTGGSTTNTRGQEASKEN